VQSDSTPVEDLLNLGPKCSEWLHSLGIYTLRDLKAIPLEELYEKVKRCVPHCNGVFLYAVFGAITDTHWNAIPRDIQAQLLQMARKIDVKIKSERVRSA
jgi:hypothetical protein